LARAHLQCGRVGLRSRYARRYFALHRKTIREPIADAQ
jgi:hypothetical protein